MKAVWCAVIAIVWAWNTPVLAVDYGIIGNIAAYRWEEQLGTTTVEEFGPVGHLGAYMVGSPVASVPSLRFRGDVLGMLGSVDYDTVLISSPGTRVDTSTNYIGHGEELSVGWRQLGGDMSVEPFVGIGYRWWARTINSTPSSGGYSEYYQVAYTRWGFRVQTRKADPVSPFLNVSVDPVIWAREDVNLSHLGGGILRLENGKRTGWTIEGGVGMAWGSAGMFWRATRFGESNAVPCGFIPGNCLQPPSTQDIFGLQIDVRL